VDPSNKSVTFGTVTFGTISWCEPPADCHHSRRKSLGGPTTIASKRACSPTSKEKTMRHDARGLLAVLMALTISACSPEEPAQERKGALPEDNVFSDQVKTLQRAKDVQQTLDAAAARQQDAIERQERP
jgi:hypothetical protein